VKPFIARTGYAVPGGDDWLARMVTTLRERANTLVQVVDLAQFYLSPTIGIDATAARKFLKPEILPPLRALRAQLAGTVPWDVETIRCCFETVTDGFGLSLGQIAQPVRVAVTGRTSSPGIFEVLDVLGKERSLERLDRAIERLGEMGSSSPASARAAEPQ
jgi:glutamyl-tRNA synthetase